MTLTLYAHRLSQPCRAAEILLRELAIDYTYREIDFAHGETRDAWFAHEINPFRKIPVLHVGADNDGDDGDNPSGFMLGESHAIMRYLCRTGAARETADAWYPSDRDPQHSARIDQWLAWHHNNVRRYDMFHEIMNLHLTLPMLKHEIQETRLEPLQAGLSHALAQLERHFDRPGERETPPTLCGDTHPTLADLAVACELYQIVAVGYRFDRYPRVAEWLDLVAQRPSFQEVSQAIRDQGRAIREESGDYLDLGRAFV